jgi:ABC-type glycerol-3-phosphate transport system substrate-binding protein
MEAPLMKKISCVILVLFALVSCEKAQTPIQTESPTNSQTTQPDNYVWQAEYHVVESGSFQAEHPVVVGDTVYFFSTVMVEAQPPRKDGDSDGDFPGFTYETKFYSIKTDGTDFREIDGFVPSKPPQEENTGGHYSVTATELASDSAEYVVETGDFSCYDSENEWVTNVITNIRKIDLQTGKELLKINFSPVGDKFPNSNADYIMPANDGALVVASRYWEQIDRRQLFLFSVFDKNGNYLNTHEYELGIQNLNLLELVSLPDGRVAVLLKKDDINELRPIDLSTGELQDSIGVLPSRFGGVAGISKNGEFISLTSSGIEYAKPGDSTGSEYVSWLDCDIDPYSMQYLGIYDEEIICTSMIYGSFGVEFNMIIIKKVPESELKRKTILTLACNQLNYNMRSTVLNFNKTNTNYRIKVNDYSKYNTGGDPSAGITKLNTEIISGNVPDILLLDGLPYGIYESKGVLADLYPFVDGDAELGGRGGIVPAVLKTIESKNGALYRVASAFAINTAIANVENSGSENGWSMNDLNVVKERNSNSAVFGNGTVRNDILNQILQNSLREYVDWQTGAVRFDSKEFIDLIEFVKQFPSEINADAYDYYSIDNAIQRIISGEQIAEVITIWNFDSFMDNATLFNNREVYKGFPCESKQGSSFALYDTIAMTSQCKDKNGAWEFIRILLGTEYYSQYNQGFPVNKQIFDTQVADYLTPMYLEPVYDENGELIPEAMSGEFEYCRINPDGTIEGPKGFAHIVGSNDEYTYIPYYAMSEEQRSRITSFVDSIKNVYEQDANLSIIIAEELAPFFTGQKDAESTAKIIQSRAQIYVSEQR